MKVSFDRVNWTTLAGDWYPSKPNRSIFASNSDTIKTTDTHLTASDGHKIPVANQKIESRVINMSGLIIGTDIYDVREKETEIKELLINRVVYFYDEYVGKVFYGYVPNINQSNYRGKYDGRASLLNVNITLYSPYYEDMLRTEVSFENKTNISVTNLGESVPYVLTSTPSSYPRTIDGIFNNALTFSNPITLTTNQYIRVSTEGDDISVVVTDTTETPTVISVLGTINDSFFTDYYLLTKGSNSFTVHEDLAGASLIEFTYFNRSI